MPGIVRTRWSLSAGARALANSLRRGLVVHLLRRRARAFLEGMPDHVLADIGLRRAEIPKAVERMIARDFDDTAPQPPAAAPAEAEPELRRAA